MEYNEGAEFEAFIQSMKGRCKLHGSNIYLTDPETNNVVVWSSNLPDGTTVILHTAKDPKPDIEEHENTVDDITDS